MHSAAGHILCRTTHLTIFGGVLGIILDSIVSTLVCSTVGALVTAEALGRLGSPHWLASGPALVMLGFVLLLVLSLSCAVRSDWKAEQAVPWSEREVRAFQEGNACPTNSQSSILDRDLPVGLACSASKPLRLGTSFRDHGHVGTCWDQGLML